MIKFLLFLFIVFPFWGVATDTYKWDILYHNQDTLAVNKSYFKEFFEKFGDQSTELLKNNSKPTSTAFWKIENEILYLVRVLNCEPLTNRIDTLDLELMFGKRCLNDKVKYDIGRDTLIAYRSFLLRKDNFLPVYYRDFYFLFKESQLVKVDSLMNYVDSKDRLNRYTTKQLEGALYKEILNSLEFRANTLNFDLGITFSVRVNNYGDVVYFKPTQVRKYLSEDSVVNIRKGYAFKYFDLKEMKKLLKQKKWDEIKLVPDDFVEVHIFYDYKKKTFVREYGSSSQYEDYLKEEIKALPLYIQKVYFD